MSGILLACALIASATWAGTCLEQRAAVEPAYLWIDAEPKPAPDTRGAFRGTFTLGKETEVEVRLLGASWFNAWIDGRFLTEGPARFTKGFPEYSTHSQRLPAGKHILAVEVIHEGVATRIMESQPPFLFAEVLVDGKPIEIDWKASKLGGHRSQTKRINPQLGWIEWCDTRAIPDWQSPAFDGQPWGKPMVVKRDIGQPRKLSIVNPRLTDIAFSQIAKGDLVETFGYEQDDPAARFFLRDLNPKGLPARGVWRRYDLGKVGLWRPQVTLDLPKGAVVEFAYSEALHQGRVSPWITLSAGPSCHLDHYVARGGRQTFQPLITRGGRFVEVHVLADPAKVRFLDERFLLRRSGVPRLGKFTSEDALLNRIWEVGADTLDSCMEDAVIDNPTRERGQWTGDVAAVGMEIATATTSDLRHFRRGLVQSAENARADGLVAGMCPGQNIHLSTYAALWTSACVRYWRASGDKTLLRELFVAAEKNIAAFEAKRTKDGIPNSLAWAFVDWGYIADSECDTAMNLMYLEALEHMTLWSHALGKSERASHYEGLAKNQRSVVAGYFTANPDWKKIGFHRAAFGLRLGVIKGDREKAAVGHIKSHILSCFPNNLKAPRLSDPGVQETQLITPYFAHFAMPELIERGEMDFVLDQYRKCWGWMLKDGQTTWMEVFDPRWSHCHQWSGAPTWQLSQYALGLRRRFDLGSDTYEISLKPGALKKVSGRIPQPFGFHIEVSWVATSKGIEFTLKPHGPFTVVLSDGKRVRVEKETKLLLSN